MERSLSVDRLFSLGDYKNIRFTNILGGIPEELAQNDKVVSLLFFQQALSCEIAYRNYYELMEKIAQDYSTTVGGKKVADAQAVMEFLQEQREETLAQLYEEIRKVGEEKQINEKETE